MSDEEADLLCFLVEEPQKDGHTDVYVSGHVVQSAQTFETDARLVHVQQVDCVVDSPDDDAAIAQRLPNELFIVDHQSGSCDYFSQFAFNDGRVEAGRHLRHEAIAILGGDFD